MHTACRARWSRHSRRRGQGSLPIGGTERLGGPEYQGRRRNRIVPRPLTAAPAGLLFPAGQPGQESAHPLLHRLPAPQAQIAGGLPRFHEGRLSLAQPQMASAALKSGLYPGRFTSRGFRPGLLREAPPRHDAPARCPRSRSAGRRASSATAPGRLPMSRSCCCPPNPSTPHPQSPGTPLSSSRPSPRTVGCWSPSEPAPVKTGAGSPLSTRWPRSSASARKWTSSAGNTLAPARWASSLGAAYSATKASRCDSFALTKRFLGRLRANSSRCRACPRGDGGSSDSRCGSN